MGGGGEERRVDRKDGSVGGREGGRKGGREEGKEGERKKGREGGREREGGKRRGSDGGTLCLSRCHAAETNLTLFHSALHLAIIHNHQDVVLQLLDVLPQLPPTETPVVDCVNNFKQVSQSVSLQCHVWQSCVEIECCIFQTSHLHI